MAKNFLITANVKFKKGLDMAAKLANTSNSAFVRSAVLSAARAQLFYAETLIADIGKVDLASRAQPGGGPTLPPAQLAGALVRGFREIERWKKVISLLEETEE